MRRIGLTALIVLALLMLLPQAGSFLLALRLIEAQAHAQRMSRKGFENELLIVIDLPKSAEKATGGRFQRIHAGEFRWDDQLYDIVSAQDLGPYTRYLVYPDHKETKLQRKIARKMSENGQKPWRKSLDQLFSFHWICHRPQENETFVQGRKWSFSDLTMRTQTPYRALSAEPPDKTAA